MFGSFGAGFGSFGAGVGGLLPSFTNITSWLKTPTADGKTLDNSKGADATLTGVNCLNFDGSGDRVLVPSAGGVDITTDASNILGSCVITATFRQDVAGTQVIHSVGGSSYRLFTALGNLRVNALATNIFPVVTGKVYRSTITYDSNAQVTNFVLENLTDGTTQTDSTTRAAGLHGGNDGFQIGTRNTGLVFNGKISNVSVSNSSVGANIHLPLAEGYGSVAYDVSGNGANGNIIGATWATATMPSWNHQYGHDLVGVLNGTVSGFDTGIGGNELDMYEIKMQSTADAGGDGNSYFVSNGSTNATLFMTNTTQGSGKRMSFRVTSGSIEHMSGISSADFKLFILMSRKN